MTEIPYFQPAPLPVAAQCIVGQACECADGSKSCPRASTQAQVGQAPAVKAEPLTEARIAEGLRQYRQRPGHRRHGDAFRAGIEFALAASQPPVQPTGGGDA